MPMPFRHAAEAMPFQPVFYFCTCFPYDKNEIVFEAEYKDIC